MLLSAEDFERAAVMSLQGGLQTSLTTVAAHYLTQDQQDGLADPDGTSWVTLLAPERTTGPPSGMGDYYPGGIDVPSAWPSIEVAVPDQTVTNFAIGQVDADTDLNLVVQIWLKDARFPVLNRMMKRYAAAVLDVLRQPGALGDVSIGDVRFAWRTNPEVRDANDRITSGVLLFLTLGTGLIRA